MNVIQLNTPLSFKLKVLAGVKWLNENAPEGWKQHFFGYRNGGRIFKMQLLSATESVLPLAFTGKRIAPHMSHCGIGAHFDLSQDKLIEYGFHAGSMRYVPAIEHAWKEVLGELLDTEDEHTEDGSLR